MTNQVKIAMNTIKSKQQGMTLTELMVAVAVGLIVSAAVAGLFLQTTASNNQNSEITYIQDNGRYALKLLASDLEMSNFWAGLAASNSGSIDIDDTAVAQDGGAATITATIDPDVNVLCGDGAASVGDNWNYDFSQPLEILVDTTEANAEAAYPCINNSDNALDFVDNTDVLVVKRTKGFEETTSQTNGRPYVRGNRNVATLHKYVSGTTDDPPSGYFDWQYINHVYYIAQDDSCTAPCTPKLVRQALKEDSTPSNDPSFSTEELAVGIERFHIMFGIDTDADAVVDTFTSTPTAAQLLNAVIAKIYILARGESQVTGYTNNKTYQLGDLAVGAANDGFYRRVFTTTVIMKNTEAVIEMGAI